MNGPELLAVAMQDVATSAEVYSGVARMAATLWCTRHRATPGRRADAAVIVCHPSSNFMGHYALPTLAAHGVDAVGMTTRHVGNDSVLLLENCVQDVGSVVRHLRNEGYERVVLVGNSGGGGLAALYQNQAEAPSITGSPGGGGPDLTAADLPPLDGLVLLMAHPGRAQLLTEWLDPAIIDEQDPFNRDADLDMFRPENGPPYSEEFVSRYRAAQVARNSRITDQIRAALADVTQRTDGRVSDLPFRVHATCADPRFLDMSLDPSDREPGSLWGDPMAANFQPTTFGHLTGLRSWLSQYSLADTHGDGLARLASVTAPVHVIYGTADQGCFPSHAQSLYDAVPHDKKVLTPVVGGRHYLNGQPEKAELMARTLTEWVRDLP